MSNFDDKKINMSNLQKDKQKISTATVAKMGMMVALLIVGAQVSIPLPFSPVPLTMQTLAVMLVAVVFKPLHALATVSIYVLMGTVGIPVFAGFRNFAAFASPTGGFIVSFLPAVFVMSLFVSLIQKRFHIRYKTTTTLITCSYKYNLAATRITKYICLILTTILFTVIVYAFGASWFIIFTRNFAAYPRPILFGEALLLVTVPFLPGDAIKAAILILCFNRIAKLRKQ